MSAPNQITFKNQRMRIRFVLIGFLGLLLSFSCSPKERTLKTIKGNEIALSKIDDFISSNIDSLGIVGVSVSIVSGSQIVYGGHFGKKRNGTKEKIDERIIYEVASLSKPVFALFVMKQVEKDLLDLDKPLFHYLPNLNVSYDDRYKKITARMVLSHATGFPNWRTETNDSLKIKFDPGTQYGYSGEGYEYLKNVLGHLLNVNDRGLDSLFRKEITEPLDIGDMSFTWQKKYEVRKAFGHINNESTDNTFQEAFPFFQEQGPDLFASSYSLYSTSDAYAKFLVAMMQKMILSNTSFKELMRFQTEMPKFPDTGTHRSLLAFMKKTSDGIRYFHSGDNGDFQAWTHFYPSKNFGVVILTNGDNLFTSGFGKNLLVFLDEEVNN